MTKYFTKTEYEDFNKKIRDYYYNDNKKKTKLIPTENIPSHLKHQKVAIMLDILDNKGNRISDLVYKRKKLIQKHKIKLFHIGEQKNNLVSLGYDDENDIFLHPSIDFGGLTNIGQTPGDNIYKLTKRAFYRASKGKLYRDKFFIDGNININLIIDDIYLAWKTLSKKQRFYGDIKSNLVKVLESIKKYLKKTNQKAFICFYQLITEHSIIVKKKDIKQRFGIYMIRTFSGDDNKYAKISNDKNLFTVVKEKYANLNINLNNIRNEYSVY